MRFIIHWIAGLLRWTIVAILYIAAIISLLLTPVGLKISLAILSKTVPGQLSYTQIKGSILGPLSIKHLYYHHGDQNIIINDLFLSWHPFALIQHKQIVIENLVIHSLRITSPLPENPAPPVQPSSPENVISQLKNLHDQLTLLHLPIYVEIKKARIDHLALGEKAHEYPLQANKINLQARLVQTQVWTRITGILLQPYPAEINLTLQGAPGNYQVQLGVKNPSYFWIINSIIAPDKMQIDTQKALIFGGEVNAHLTWYWQEQNRWDLILQAKHLDITDFYPNFPHPFNIDLKSQGYFLENKPFFNWNATANTQQTKVITEGEYNNQWNIKWNINANQLAELIPYSSGNLRSIGELHGDLKKPISSGTLEGKLLRWKNYRMDKISAHWNIDFSEIKNSLIGVNAEQLFIQDWKIQKIDLAAQGKTTKHTVNLHLNALDTDVNLELNGGLIKDNWQGTLNKLNISAPNTGAWTLQSPTALILSQKKIGVQPLCLQSPLSSKICFQGNWLQASDAWSGSIDGRINLQQIMAFLPNSWNVNLFLNVHGNANGVGKKILAADFKALGKMGELSHHSENSNFKAVIDNIGWTAQLNDKGLNSHFNLNIENQNTLTADFKFPGIITTDIFRKTQPLQGKIDLELNDFSFTEQLIPSIVTPKGKFHGNFTIGGTMGMPEINGEAGLERGDVKIPGLNIQLNTLALKVHSKGPVINYVLSALSVKQPIIFSGQTDISKPGFPTEADFISNNVLLGDTSRFTFYLSPNVHISYRDHDVKLTGMINIPQAVIKQLDFYTQTTLPENEVIFIGEQPLAKPTPWNITTEITINLGNDVTVDTPTLKSKLTGSLTLISEPKQVLLARGSINLVGGIYNVFGRNLTITPGSSIIYRRNPVDNPFLSLQAVTKVIITDALTQQQLGTNEITVGMNIGGNAKNPQITLFSSAGNLSQADMLSYLLVGTSSAGISPLNMNLMLQALNSLPLTKQSAGNVESITEQIKQGLGFSELGIESGEASFSPTGVPIPTSTPPSYFVVGKKLTSRIYFRYLYDPFNQVNYFQLSYLFTKNWSVRIETDAQNASGADILYSFEAGMPQTPEQRNPPPPPPKK